MQTRTGSFRIGFRRLIFSEWQKNAASLIEWAKRWKLDLIDLGRDADVGAKAFLDAGIAVGSADLPEWDGMISPDAGRRKSAVEKNAAYMRACTAMGIRNFFVVMLPEKPELPRSENFGFMVDSLNALGKTFDETGARIVIEGWPGPGALCCTPETVRATLKATHKNVGLNYDPSHLIRMSIDPLRFLEEFADRVYHVHGKDCEILAENLYEFGSEQPPTWGKWRGFGGVAWRYTLPGHGSFRWTRALEILAARGYDGGICVELEDEHYNGTEEGEKRGIVAAAHFLTTC